MTQLDFVSFGQAAKSEQSAAVNSMAPKPSFVDSGSMWLVIYECIYQVIWVSPDGKGFFACGQEPLWSFDNVNEWIAEIKPNEIEALHKTKRVV